MWGFILGLIPIVELLIFGRAFIYNNNVLLSPLLLYFCNQAQMSISFLPRVHDHSKTRFLTLRAQLFKLAHRQRFQIKMSHGYRFRISWQIEQGVLIAKHIPLRVSNKRIAVWVQFDPPLNYKVHHITRVAFPVEHISLVKANLLQHGQNFPQEIIIADFVEKVDRADDLPIG